jgi:hypothetical protein
MGTRSIGISLGTCLAALGRDSRRGDAVLERTVPSRPHDTQTEVYFPNVSPQRIHRKFTLPLR